MKALFNSTNKLDLNAINLGLSELILQENAANAVASCVRKNFKFKEIFAFCGGGNNGADAIATLRILSGEFCCTAILLDENLNKNAKIQLEIAKNVGVNLMQASEFFALKNFKEFCIIDGIFGSGLSRDLDENLIQIIQKLNSLNSLKISVDIPSGIDKNGNLSPICFKADFVVTMGAHKLALYSDFAKDFIGKIMLANLGLCNKIFCQNFSSDYLLEFSDLTLPKRELQNVNKGDFGHAFVALGSMEGAGTLSALCALNMGAGKVSIVGEAKSLNPQLMQKQDFKQASAVAVGMGLGSAKFDFKSFLHLPCVVDADMFYKDEVLEFAKSKNAVLTPHPKEFANLLKIAKIGEFSVQEVLKNKFNLAREFSKIFPCVLLLKGANTIIAHNEVLYICALGSSKLAKAGSGDALAGIILGYLAQNFTPLKAAINATLVQAKIAQNYDKNDFSYTANDMIEGIKCL